MEGMKEVLTIDVEITGAEEVKGADGEAVMISFGGSIDCENFHGKILPGGIDTQTEWAGMARSLSARYILEGVDREGQECRIFVENNGVTREGEDLRTTPRIITDSKALRFLGQEKLIGTITPAEGGVTIHIFVREDPITKIDAALPWQGCKIPENIPQGDMPGDQIKISEEHIKKANVLFPELLGGLKGVWEKNPYHRAVITVCGGSGVGKSEIASLLAYYFRQAGIGSYTLSGDNYPHRIPMYNDAERLHIFRESGIRGMVEDGVFSRERFDLVRGWQAADDDANPVHKEEYPWFSSYLKAGREGLRGYLGTPGEIDFAEVSRIVKAFKNGEERIWLKRMGREETALWYEEVDFAPVNVLIIEWTHGNSDHYDGVDFPILLNSTPQETLAHRRARNRDGKTDSAFTMLVLEIEQELLKSQAKRAKLILSKEGKLLSYDDYCRLMEESEEADSE